MIDQVLTAGTAEGLALVLSRPLSFWGGVDAVTGKIIDRSHPDLGARVTKTVLVMPGGRGSSSSAAVLAEMIRLGTSPSGILLATPDAILTVGAIVAKSLYGLQCPIVVCATDGIRTGDWLRIHAAAGGPVLVERMRG
jgi:hypothetical protein